MTDATKIGPYTVVRRLGMGGTSEVLLALSRGPLDFERYVVIKRLLPRFRVEPAMARMLAREAMAYARLSHPAIVRLYDFLDDDGELALVLEHVDGTTLARLRTTLRARGHRLGDDAAYYVGKRVFAALAAAHGARDPATGAAAPVVHRDVSPGNVLVPSDGFVKLADFGIAKVSGVTSDTQDGLIKGTDGYMAPEQVMGRAITPATDVYAACLVLRELLVGKPAFTRGRSSELDFLRAMAEPEVPPIERLRPDVPPAVADALRRGLEAEPAARTLSASEMVAVLASVVDGERGRASLVRVLASMPPPEPLDDDLAPSPAALAPPPRATPEPSVLQPSGALVAAPPARQQPSYMPEAVAPRGPSSGALRAHVLGTPYAYGPARPVADPTTAIVPSRAPPRGGAMGAALLGAGVGVVLVACSTLAWSLAARPTRAAASASPSVTAAAVPHPVPRVRFVPPRKARARGRDR
jgi:eukaryotic-like serine/threonine-protein kinase